MSDHRRLNLRWSPFGAAYAEERTTLAVVDFAPLQALLCPGAAVQLRADHGRGNGDDLRTMEDHLYECIEQLTGDSTHRSEGAWPISN